MDERWMGAIDGSLTDSDLESLLGATVEHLDALLTENPGLLRTFCRLLAGWLDEPVGTETWDQWTQSVATLTGWDVAHLVTWLAHAETEQRLALVSAAGSSDAEWFLREVLSRFGASLRASITRRWELPDDWQGIRTTVHKNVMSGDYLVRAEIDKMDGSTVLLEGPPDSFLNLIRVVANALNLIEGPAFSAVVAEEARESLGPLLETVESELSSPAAGYAGEPDSIVAASTGPR